MNGTESAVACRFAIRKALAELPNSRSVEGAMRIILTDALTLIERRMCDGCTQWKTRCDCDKRRY